MKKLLIPIFMLLVACSTSFVLSVNHGIKTEKTETILTEQQIEKRIYNLYNKLGEGSFFTTNRKDACGKKTMRHSCDNCSLTLVMRNNWFITKFGRLSTDQFPSTYYSSGRRYGPKGYSCYGFGSFAEWYICSLGKDEFVKSRFMGKYSYDYEGVRDNISVGDLIRLDDKHSAIVISYDETGVKVLDNNKKGDMNCQVFVHTIPFDEYEIFTVNRAMNSEKFKSDKSFSPVLNEQQLSLNYKETVQLTSLQQDVTWSSSNPKIATVDEEGRVTIHDEGKVKIMVSSEKEGVIDYCDITAKYSLWQKFIMNFLFGWVWY